MDTQAKNSRAEILSGFDFYTDKQLVASQPEIVMADKEQKRAAVIDVAI